MTRRGISLLEVVVASFVLLVVMVGAVGFMMSSARAAAASEESARAALFAENVLAEIRRWAENPVNFADWSTYDGASLTDPNFPGLTAEVAVEESGRRLYSPCTGLESVYADPVVLQRAVVAVRVQVGWDPTNPARRVRLITYIDEPDRSPATIRLTRAGPANPVPQNGEVTFTVDLVDATGAVIPDATFEWSALPITGNGRFLPGPPRSGASCVYKNHYLPPLGPGRFVPGTLELEARAVYRGRPLWQTTPVVLQ